MEKTERAKFLIHEKNVTEKTPTDWTEAVRAQIV